MRICKNRMQTIVPLGDEICGAIYVTVNSQWVVYLVSLANSVLRI